MCVDKLVRVRLKDWFQVDIYQDLGVVVDIRLVDAASGLTLVEGVTVFNEEDKLRYVTLNYCGELKSEGVYLFAFIGTE